MAVLFIEIDSNIFTLYTNNYINFIKWNKKRNILAYVSDDKKGEEFSKIFHEIKNQDQYKLNSEFNIKNKNISLQKSINLIKILTNNPYIKNPEAKKKIFERNFAIFKIFY